MLLSLRSNPQTGSPYIQNCDGLLSQIVTYLFCDWLNTDSKVLIDRVRQETRDIVKSEV